MDWTDQKARSSPIIVDADGSTTNPYIPTIRWLVRASRGDHAAGGIEFEGGYPVTRALRLDPGVEWNHTDYNHNLIETLAGTKNMTGNRANRNPEGYMMTPCELVSYECQERAA